mmetsp:Transcript_41910/g.110436  ORF Transcript_41910/g.110436 Transcript_41910/m.110436 type:complete len:213 (+) Transcript_41910:578-1216(+)
MLAIIGFVLCCLGLFCSETSFFEAFNVACFLKVNQIIPSSFPCLGGGETCLPYFPERNPTRNSALRACVTTILAIFAREASFLCLRTTEAGHPSLQSREACGLEPLDVPSLPDLCQRELSLRNLWTVIADCLHLVYCITRFPCPWCPVPGCFQLLERRPAGRSCLIAGVPSSARLFARVARILDVHDESGSLRLLGHVAGSMHLNASVARLF